MSLAFYLGYANLSLSSYGSELAMLKLVKQLQKDYKVSIVSFDKTAVKGYDIISHEEYAKRSFDCVIISRYINFYIYLPLRAPKVYIWLHDIGIQSSYKAIKLPSEGRYLLENVICDGLIAQSEWHKEIAQKLYPNTEITIIGNGIDTDKFHSNVECNDCEEERVPYRFIWTSSPTRGLSTLLEMFPYIKQKYPESELYIYRGMEEFTQEQLDTISNLDYVFNKGYIENDTLAKKFLSSDVWLYPTNFSETYCISALEAQTAGCLCVCSNLAGLKNIVGERGILLNTLSIEEVLSALDTVFSERDLRRKASIEWGMKQDWKNRAEMWKNLLGVSCLSEYERSEIERSERLIPVINLDRRKDRWERMKSELSELSIERFSAVNGKELTMTPEIKHLFERREYKEKNPHRGHLWMVGVIGCALSHISLWKRCVEENKIMVVFEDDIIKCENFKERFDKVMGYLERSEIERSEIERSEIERSEWDVCFLGYLDDRPIYDDKLLIDLGEVAIHTFNPEARRTHGGGTHGYVINPKGAKKYLELIEKCGIPQPIDWFMIEMFGEIKALKCLPHLVEQVQGDTDIQYNNTQLC